MSLTNSETSNSQSEATETMEAPEANHRNMEADINALSELMKGSKKTSSSESGSGSATSVSSASQHDELEFEPGAELKTEPEGDRIEIGDNEDLPELAVECIDSLTTLTCKWGYSASALSRTERRDLKSMLAKQRFIEMNGNAYQPSEYELYLLGVGEEIIAQEKDIPLTEKEKKSLQAKISRVMKAASIKVNNPVAALWGTLAIILLTRLLPILTNMMDRMMNRSSKPKREFGSMIQTQNEKRTAA